MVGYVHSVPFKMAFRMLALAGIVLLSGCGSLSQSPSAPNLPAATRGLGERASFSDGPVYLSFSPGASLRSTKPTARAGIYTESASGWFSPVWEGRLQVSFPRYADAGEVQVKKATFEVERGAVEERQKITMRVTSGKSLSDVVIAFSPEGLSFDPPATLTIVLRGKVDPEAIQVYHLHGGVVEKTSAEVEEGERTTTVIVRVFSFSRYVLPDGSEPPPEAEGP